MQGGKVAAPVESIMVNPNSLDSDKLSGNRIHFRSSDVLKMKSDIRTGKNGEYTSTS